MSSARDASHRQLGLVVAPVLGSVSLLVVVVAAAAGPVTLFGSASPSGGPPSGTVPRTSPVPSDATPLMPTYAELTRNAHEVIDLSWVTRLAAWTAVLVAGLLLLRLVVRGVPWLWRRRWRPPQRPADVVFETLPADDLREALADDEAAERALVERVDVRDAVVACWLRLEEVVARSGVARDPSETSTELATRVLRSLDVDPRAVGTLAGLYREARFSEHPLGEDSRQAARAALQALYDDLPDRAAVR